MYVYDTYMCVWQGKLSEPWAAVTRRSVSAALLSLSRLPAERRAPAACLRSGTLWRALVALCVLQPEHADRLTSGHWRPAAGHSGPARVSPAYIRLTSLFPLTWTHFTCLRLYNFA